jgi:hypothetical protein
MDVSIIKNTLRKSIYTNLWAEAAAGIIQAQKANNQQLLSYECDWTDLRAQNSRYVNMKNGSDDKDVHFQAIQAFHKANGQISLALQTCCKN